MISLTVKYFDLRRICNSGQIFRMYEREEGVFDVYSADRHLRLKQRGETVDFFCDREEYDGYWRRYFDLDRDYESLIRDAVGEDASGSLRQAAGEAVSEGLRQPTGRAVSGSLKQAAGITGRDEYVASACSFGAGIRILHQDIWEMLISFIISQQKQIPSIRKCIEALCERFGERKAGGGAYPENEEQEHVWYTFPTPKAIAGGGPEGLKGLSLGYRERYIYETSVKYLTDGLDYETVENMGLDAAKAYFTSFCGVGEKVANCICLFGAGYVDAFPIDTHIKDILYREYYLRDVAADDGKNPGESLKTGVKQKESRDCTEAAGEPTENRDCTEAAEEPTGKNAVSAGKDRRSDRDHGLGMSDYERLVKLHFDRFSGYRGIVQQWIFAWELVRGDKTRP